VDFVNAKSGPGMQVRFGSSHGKFDHFVQGLSTAINKCWNSLQHLAPVFQERPASLQKFPARNMQEAARRREYGHYAVLCSHVGDIAP
jgi:hypothetical protein